MTSEPPRRGASDALTLVVMAVVLSPLIGLVLGFAWRSWRCGAGWGGC